MTKRERVREVPSGPLTPDYVSQKANDGWKLAAVEWEREVEEPEGALSEEVPYGLRVSADCTHLEENSAEKQALVLMMDLIVQDHPLSYVARELNLKGFRTREGQPWNQVAVFNMLPRLVDVGPKIFSSSEWEARRKRVMAAGH